MFFLVLLLPPVYNCHVTCLLGIVGLPSATKVDIFPGVAAVPVSVLECSETTMTMMVIVVVIMSAVAVDVGCTETGKGGDGANAKKGRLVENHE